jgi:parallel beta-helix repeat protein
MQTVLEGHTRGLMVDGKGAATSLFFPPGKTGIIVNRHDTPNEHDVVSDSGSAASSILRGLGFFAQGITSIGSDEVRGSGILARAMVEIDRCAIDGFSNHGVAIVANVGGGDGGQRGEASECRVLNSQINQNRNHGIYLAGSDVNIASIKACRIGYNGGWGILNTDAGPCYTESIHYVSNGKAGSTGQAATSMVYNNGALYGLRMTSDPSVASRRGNGPPGNRSDNAHWVYLRDIASAPSDGPQWSAGMKLRNGGAGWLKSVGSVAMCPYLEGTQNGLWVNRGHDWSGVPVVGPRFEATRIFVYTP